MQAIEALELSARSSAGGSAAAAAPAGAEQQAQAPAQREVPLDFVCPITRELMRDPVVLDRWAVAVVLGVRACRCWTCVRACRWFAGVRCCVNACCHALLPLLPLVCLV